MQANIDKAALDKLLENVHTLDEKIKDAVFDEITLTALEIESDAKTLCPVVTGRLRASIKAIWDREKFAALVGTNVEYASDVEFGSNNEWQGTFKAKKGGSFVSKKTGETVKYKKGQEFKVQHKRKLAKPFLYPAYFAGIGRLSRNLQNILKDVK